MILTLVQITPGDTYVDRFAKRKLWDEDCNYNLPIMSHRAAMCFLSRHSLLYTPTWNTKHGRISSETFSNNYRTYFRLLYRRSQPKIFTATHFNYNCGTTCQTFWIVVGSWNQPIPIFLNFVMSQKWWLSNLKYIGLIVS